MSGDVPSTVRPPFLGPEDAKKTNKKNGCMQVSASKYFLLINFYFFLPKTFGYVINNS